MIWLIWHWCNCASSMYSWIWHGIHSLLTGSGFLTSLSSTTSHYRNARIIQGNNYNFTFTFRVQYTGNQKINMHWWIKRNLKKRGVQGKFLIFENGQRKFSEIWACAVVLLFELNALFIHHVECKLCFTTVNEGS